MKLMIWFSFFLFGSVVGGFAQGTVLFANATSWLPGGFDRLVRFDPTATAFNPFATNYAPVVSNLVPGLCAQLYYGSTLSTESQLIAVTNAPPSFRASTSPNAGAWFSKQVFVDLPLQGQSPNEYITANMQVRVWDISRASTYEAALMDPSYDGLIGQSAMFTQRYYWWPFDTGLTELRGFTVGLVPEPSSLCLGLTAAFLLLGVRRWH